MGERHCSKIARMQLFHELKQQFPTLPDHVISRCIDQNKANEGQCQQNLQLDSRRSRTFLPSLANRDDNSSSTDRTCSLQVMEESESPPGISNQQQQLTDKMTPQSSIDYDTQPTQSEVDSPDPEQRRLSSTVSLTLRLPSEQSDSEEASPISESSSLSRLSSSPYLCCYNSSLQVNLKRGGRTVRSDSSDLAGSAQQPSAAAASQAPSAEATTSASPSLRSSVSAWELRGGRRPRLKSPSSVDSSEFPTPRRLESRPTSHSEPVLSCQSDEFIMLEPYEDSSLPAGISSAKAAQIMAESGLYRRSSANDESRYSSSLPDRFVADSTVALALLMNRYWPSKSLPEESVSQAQPVEDTGVLRRRQREVSLKLDLGAPLYEGSGRPVGDPSTGAIPRTPSRAKTDELLDLRRIEGDNEAAGTSTGIRPGQACRVELPPLDLRLPEADLGETSYNQTTLVPGMIEDQNVEDGLTEKDRLLLLEVEEEFRQDVKEQLLNKIRLQRRLEAMRREEAQLQESLVTALKALKKFNHEDPVEVVLKSEIWQLRAACDTLIAKIDQLTNGKVPLGETSPESLASLTVEGNDEAQSTPSFEAAASSAASSSTTIEKEPDGPPWKCKKCTFLNHPLSFECGICEIRRENESEEAEGASGGSEESPRAQGTSKVGRRL